MTTSAGICLANLRPFKMCTVPITFMIVKSVLEKKNHSVFHSNFPFLYAHNLRKCLREELVVLGHGLKRGFFFRKIEEKSLFAGLRKNRKASVFVCLQMYCITTCFSLINQVGVVGRERNNTWLLLKKIHLI